jgi:excisionase family DNA binding protein
MSTTILDDLLTVRELSKWLRLSESHIYSLVSKKKVPYNKVGGKVLFDKQKIKNWIEAQSN